MDVSGDPEAAARTNVGSELRDTLARLGFEPMGHVLSRSDTSQIVSEIWVGPGGRSVAALTHSAWGDVVGFKSLLDDGSIVSTEWTFPGLWGRLAAHGVRVTESSGYFWSSSRSRDAGGVLAEHERALELRIAESGANVVPSDLAAYLAMSLRYRDIADPAFEIQEQVAKRTLGVTVIAILVAAVLLWSRRADLSVAVAIVLGLVLAGIGLFAFPFGLLVLGPVAARRRVVPRVALEELIERGKTIPAGSLPPLEALIVPDDKPLQPERQARLERVDAALFAFDAAVLPLAVLALAAPFGTAGVAFALGLEYLSRGAVAVRSRQPRLVVLRDKLVGELVAREPVSVGAACPMTSPLMAWIQLLAGLVLLGLAVRMRRDGESQALSPPVLWLIGSVAVLMAGAAIRSARLRHRATRAARARAERSDA